MDNYAKFLLNSCINTKFEEDLGPVSILPFAVIMDIFNSKYYDDYKKLFWKHLNYCYLDSSVANSELHGTLSQRKDIGESRRFRANMGIYRSALRHHLYTIVNLMFFH